MILGGNSFLIKTFLALKNTQRNRLTGPFKGNPEVGTWLAKLILLPPLLLILYDKYKLQIHQNYFTYAFFIISTIVFLTIFITGERMQLLLILSSILIFVFGLISEKIFSLKKISLLLILSISIILIFAINFPETTQRAFFSTIEKIINWRSSDYGLVWQSAYDVWMQSPLFGVGLHKYREACVNLGIYGTSHMNAIGSGFALTPITYHYNYFLKQVYLAS